ncbi:MAG: hypothetical protein LBQ22_12800 [Bacteroidales bacterium]|jgi:hypothetical protein|nr:hypothetical protein [Bacteroidales bacterium]
MKKLWIIFPALALTLTFNQLSAQNDPGKATRNNAQKEIKREGEVQKSRNEKMEKEENKDLKKSQKSRKKSEKHNNKINKKNQREWDRDERKALNSSNADIRKKDKLIIANKE